MNSRQVDFHIRSACANDQHDLCWTVGYEHDSVRVCSCECHYTHSKEKLARILKFWFGGELLGEM